MSSPSSIASSSNDNVPPSRRPQPPQQRSVTPTPQELPLSTTSEPPRFHKGGRHGRHKLKGRGGAKPPARRKSSSSLSSLSDLNPDSTMDDSTARDDTQQSSEPSPTTAGSAAISENPPRPNPGDGMDVDNPPPATTTVLRAGELGWVARLRRWDSNWAASSRWSMLNACSRRPGIAGRFRWLPAARTSLSYATTTAAWLVLLFVLRVTCFLSGWMVSTRPRMYSMSVVRKRSSRLAAVERRRDSG